MKRFVILITLCCSLSGCASLMLQEQERALYEKYEKGKISKVEYFTQKSIIEKKQSELSQ